MNLQNQEIEQELNLILLDIQDEILCDEREILDLMIPQFEALSEEDQIRYKLYINKHYQRFSFSKNEKFLIVQQIEEIEKEDVWEISKNEKQDKLQSLVQQKDWETFLVELQNENFCTEANIPKFWGSQESIQFLSSNLDIFPKILQLLDIENHQQGYDYLNKIQVWFELLLETSKKNDQERLILERIIGSCLIKQILQYLEYKDAVRNMDQTQYGELILNLQKYQFKQITIQELIKLGANFQTIIQLQTKLMSKQNFETYLRNFFQVSETLDFQVLKIQLLKLLTFSSINIEELYFIIFFYFLNQYNNQYDFQKVYEKLESDLTKLIGKQDRQENIVKRQVNKSQSIVDLFYQFYFQQLIQFQGVNKQLQEQFSSYVINQQLMESQIQGEIDFFNKKFDLQPKEYINIFNILRKMPLIKIRQIYQQDPKIEIKILLLSILQRENANYIFKIIQESQNLSIFQCAQNLESRSSQLSYEESTICLFLFIGTVYEYKTEIMEILFQIFIIEKSFGKAQLIENILSIIEQTEEIENQQHLYKKFQSISQQEWINLKYALNEKTLLILLQKFLKSYQTGQFDQEQRQIFYNMLSRLSQIISLDLDNSRGIYFFFKLQIPQSLFDILLLSNSQYQQNNQFLIDQATILFEKLLSLRENEQNQTINQLLQINQNCLLRLDIIWKLLPRIQSFEEIQKVWLIHFYNSNQNLDGLTQECQNFFNYNPQQYQQIFQSCNYFDQQNLTFEYFQKKNQVKASNQQIDQQNIQKAEFFLEQISDQQKELNKNNQIEEYIEPSQIENDEALQKLNDILTDIQDDLLNEEEDILKEITPLFQKLNRKSQDQFKIQLQEQFQGHSFIKNNLFAVETKQQCSEDFELMYQRLQKEKNWKAILIQFQNDQFCQKNAIPQFWRMTNCIKVFQNHEFILENMLNLLNLCSLNQGYHYIQILELLLIMLNYIKKYQQDEIIVTQIIGSALRVQMFQFVEYLSFLKQLDETQYNQMITEIQQYQLKQIDKVNYQLYKQEFQVILKCFTIQMCQQEIISYLNEFFEFELIGIKQEEILQKIQNSVLNKIMLEECYFVMVFYSYTSYCNIYNFQQEKNQFGDQMQKLKDDKKDRKLNQLIRVTKKLIDQNQKDEILSFLINTILYLSESPLDSQNQIENLQQSIQLQKALEEQFKKFLGKNIQELLKNSESYEVIFKKSIYLSISKANKLFGDQSQMGYKFHLLNHIQSQNYDLEKTICQDFQYQLKGEIFFNYCEDFYQRTRNQLLTIYFYILLQEIYQFSDLQPQIYIQIFRIETSFSKANDLQILQLILSQKFTKQTFQMLFDNLERLSNLKKDDWETIKTVLDQKKIENLCSFFFQMYMKFYNKKMLRDQLYCLIQNLIGFINSQSGSYLNCYKTFFTQLNKHQFIFFTTKIKQQFTGSLEQAQKYVQYKLKSNQFYQLNFHKLSNTLNYFITQIFIHPHLLKEFKILIFMLQNLLFNLDENKRNEMLKFLDSEYGNKYFNFKKLQQIIVKNSQTQLQLLYYYQLINFYFQGSDQLNLTKITNKFYEIDSELYEEVFKEENYFKCFELNPNFLHNKQIQKKFPFQANISLEDFNISLQEINQDEKQKIVDEWFQEMNNSQKFRQLIPLYFNVIKRKEHSKNLLSLLNSNKEQKKYSLNMKALFQILYNNSNHELKSMLLKLWCMINPIPFLYQNPIINEIKNLELLYCLNEKLVFVFPQCLPIINFSFSKTQGSFGKTHLINQVFYQAEIFEVSDNCELNQNTIDIMFDYCFSGSRTLAIADVHGMIPFEILIKILPLFKLWIIQMDSENELEENYDQYLQMKNKIKFVLPECCFIIRNSKTKDTETKSQLEKRIENEGISIHKIIDFTQKGLDKQKINSENEHFSRFIFEKIKNCMNQKLINSQDYLNILQNYYEKNHPEINQIKQDNQLLESLTQELNKFIHDKEGFYSQNAFPMRSLMWQIKNNKQQQYKFDGLSKEQQGQQVERIRLEINRLEKEVPLTEPTKLLELFQNIFLSTEYYILYLKFTDQIRKFNDQNTYQLQEENQVINEHLQKKKQEKKFRQSANCKSEQMTKQEVDEIKAKKKQLEQNLKTIELRNIGIELFWRELIQIKQKGQSSQLSINPAEIVANMVKKGEPFEFLDGDQLQIDSKFLTDFMKSFADPDNEKVLVLSILGPQSSGKSTILNKIFGCHFWTSVGRCTKGIYLQLLKITQKQYFGDKFDYVLILDSEGLQNPNQNDPEFDKKIALFVLAISDIILINVKGDIHQQFKNLVEMCIFTLGQMKSSISSVKQLSWCFNQNNDCKNFAPFLDQIQSIVNTLNLQVNKIEEEGDNQSFDYNEVLDLKKENIKILGFASTEQSWRINSNTGIFQEWRQQILNETFSEEAYSFGVLMIQQYLKKLKTDEGLSLPSLSQFVQNVESHWQSICRLPDLLEFTELIQYKQDQSMKGRYEQLLLKQAFDYETKIPRKIQDQVLAEKKKNFEFFKRIEIEEKQLIQQEKEKIKLELEDELQKYKTENQIQNKICKKYIRLLEEYLQTYECNCNLTLFDEIKKHEREYQQKKGFTQIEDLVAKISQDAKQLKELKGQRHLIQKKFDEIWQNIIKQATIQQEKVFQDFSQAQYQAIYSSFIQYQYISQHQKKYEQFFLGLSKISPNKQESNEKEEILRQFKLEIQSERQFSIIQNNNQNMKYYDIFCQPLTDRLKKSEKSNIVNLHNYYEYVSSFYIIQISDFIEYLTKDKFYDDFCNQINKENKYGINQCNRVKKIDQMFRDFFCILDYCYIKYDKEKLEKLKQLSIQGGKWYKLGSDKSDAFKEFQNSLQISGETSGIIMTTEFTRNLKSYYPSLNCSNANFRGQNDTDIQQQYQQYVGHILFFLQTFYIPKYNDYYETFQYIADQKNNYTLTKAFNNSIIVIISWDLELSDGWKKIYFEIYDIIKQKMNKIKKQNEKNIEENDSENEEILSSDNYLIKQIMSQIELKIIDYNKQFAKFGIIFSLIGERLIYYYSMFVIWRYSCYSKWKQLQDSIQKLQDMKEEQLKKFIADIEQNKTEQSILNAQVLAKNIKPGFLERFYLEQLEKVKQQIYILNMSCSQFILRLDLKLLQNYQQAKQDNVQDQEILDYILDQKAYIEKQVDNQLQATEKELQKEYELKLRQELGMFLKQIFNNVSIIFGITRQQTNVLKSEDYFEILDESKKVDYDNQLFLLICKCIQGEKLTNEHLQIVNKEQKEIFIQNYELIKMPIFVKMQNESEKKIPLLKPFIQALYTFLEDEIKRSLNEPLILKNFQHQQHLNKVKSSLVGCLHSCPMCKRKCDQSADADSSHIHSCSNGHQLRGMNGILINNRPSLYTCEEIDDNALISTSDSTIQKKWSDIKKAYSDWKFKDLNLNDQKIQKLKEKMMDIWNSGVGQLICQQLSKKLGTNIQFESKTDFNQPKIQSTHYLLMLDDSGSMSGQEWENAKNGALTCMKDIAKNGEAKISVIIFNTNARVVIDCEKVDIDRQKDLITFKSGGTSFDNAFLKAFDQLTKHVNKKFEKNIILFYTDGGASYPKEAVQKFCQLPSDVRNTIQLISCAEGDIRQNASLVQITDNFNKSGLSAELKSNIKVENLQKVWTEVVNQSYHNIRF